MSAIRSNGRRGSTIVPNWRWEDPTLDPYALRIAGWLASHADHYMQDCVTRNEIARRTNISAGKVTACLQKLEEQQIITVETVAVPQSQGGRRLVITFDFDAWETGEPSYHMTGPRSPHDRAPVTTRPLLKDNNREEQVVNSPSSEKSSALVVVGRENEQTNFDNFWSMYPRKVGKPQARRAFDKALKRATLQHILNGLHAWKQVWDDPQYIPHPTTWLNRDGWDDQVPARNTSNALNTILRAAERHA
jgi:DNA-binding Lrp family transcriptional regulator